MPEKQNIFPIHQDLSNFAPQFVPETFTKDEQKFLKPFFSNLDRPIFVAKNLPEEVIGALSSRYSRSTKSVRRMFLDEYIAPLLKPEEQKDWQEISKEEQKERVHTKEKLLEYIEFLNRHGGIDVITNVQRARKFFDKWLSEYGDDSIAELGTVHVFLEGVSNVVLQEIEDKRIGVSFLEKSSRYVSFADKDLDGHFKYIVPFEVKKAKLEKEYRRVMDFLFETYTEISEKYFDYICKIYPQGTDETPVSFKNSRGAKRFDDIRDLLPFATKTNVAISGNGRTFEDLINRLMSSFLSEGKWWGQALCQELNQIVPSFVVRPQGERGFETQVYRANVVSLKNTLNRKLKFSKEKKIQKWVKLVTHSKDPEIEVLSSFLFSGGFGTSLKSVQVVVKKMGLKKRREVFNKIFDQRKMGRKIFVRQFDRFRKVPRSFENATFLFEIWGRGGDYRDLHRHRMSTQERQRFTCDLGFDLETEVLKSPFLKEFENVMKESKNLYKKLYKISPDVAQYAVCFGFVQHWYMTLTAREIFWLCELRTGPQGRPHYRKISQQIGRLAQETAPSLFSGLLLDLHDYSLARRESEKKIEKRRRELGIGH